ncbi:hypothetical protein [Amycolatopsis sp. NPDC059657]|uniref:hypothetical protein n=1 Tax=Amycolatopsis sp. NPDC059657 TaxID=3346899 RepID=UPI003670937C
MNTGVFFKEAMHELLGQYDKGVRQVLTVDEYHRIHVPDRTLRRYNLDSEIGTFWDPTYNVVVLVFDKKSVRATVGDVPVEESPSVPVLSAAELFALHEGEVVLGDLPRELRYIIQPVAVLKDLPGYGGGGDEAIICFL